MVAEKWESALADCNEMIKLQPQRPEGYLLRASVHRVRKDHVQARQDYDEALRCDSKHESGLIARAWFLAACPDAEIRNGAQALVDAQAACELTAWKKLGAIEALAAAYAEQAQFDAAVRWQERALELAQGDADDVQTASKRLALYHLRQPYRE